jgi:alkylated DNA repair protein (DNA oxidative demethylase)
MHEIYGLGLGTALLRGLALEHDVLLLDTLFAVAARSQFRHMVTPGGFRMSVAITNSGSLRWVTAVDPETQALWPPMPKPFMELADPNCPPFGSWWIRRSRR